MAGVTHLCWSVGTQMVLNAEDLSKLRRRQRGMEDIVTCMMRAQNDYMRSVTEGRDGDDDSVRRVAGATTTATPHVASPAPLRAARAGR